MTKILFKNAKVVSYNEMFLADVLIEEDKIKKIGNIQPEEGMEVIELDGKILGPAFVDVHIHGAVGADTMDGKEKSLRKISEFLASRGTGNFLATSLTSSKEELIEVLKVIGKLQDKDIEGANIFGAHLEGPFFAVEYKGAQNPKYIVPATIEDIDEYLAVKEGLVKIFSISPHTKENIDMIKYIKEKGIICSVGHTSATYEDVIEAVKAGVTHATHTYNGMKGFSHRAPGVVGAIFNTDVIKAEIIFDKIHVHPASVNILMKIKGVENVECITDSMSATGLSDGNYKLGELDVKLSNNQVRLVSNNSLAGSVLTLDRAFRNLLELGYSINDCFKMTSTNAAREFNLNSGEIKEGFDADIVVLDKENQVELTMVKGKIKYKK